MPHSNWRAYAALGVGILCLGFSAIWVRWANAPGAVTSFYRMAIALTLMAWPFWRRVRRGRAIGRREMFIALVGGLFFGADLAFWTTGVVLSGATNPTLLANTAPLWVGLGALLIFRERLGAGFWLGLLLAIVGAVVVLGEDALRGAAVGLGTLFGLLAGIFYGAYFLVTQRGRQSLDTFTYFWLAALGSTLFTLAAAVLLRQPLTGYSLNTYLNFLGLGVVTQVIGYVAINYALGHLPASIVSPTLLGQPVVTALLAGPLLGEQLSLIQVLGGAAVLAGVYVVHRSRSPAGPAATPIGESPGLGELIE